MPSTPATADVGQLPRRYPGDRRRRVGINPGDRGRRPATPAYRKFTGKSTGFLRDLCLPRLNSLLSIHYDRKIG